MAINNIDDDDRPDYFSGEDIPEPEPKKREPRLTPDDPKYWEYDRKPWEREGRRVNWGLMIAIVMSLIVVIAAIAFYMRFFVAYADDCTEYGYIDNIERRGMVFKTYEGVMISYKNLMDSTRSYNRDFIFSTPNEKLGQIIASQARNGKPVMVKYKKYNATVPWRGETKIEVLSVDTIDPRRILHPDAMPEILK